MGLYYEIRGSIYPVINENFNEIIGFVKNKSIYDDLIRIKEELNNMNDKLNNFDLSFLPDEFNKKSKILKYIFVNIPWHEIDNSTDCLQILEYHSSILRKISSKYSRCTSRFASNINEKHIFDHKYCLDIDCEDCLRNALHPYKQYFVNQ